MNIVDLLIAVVVVTILVTIILAVVTYVAYKLRLSREPTPRDEDPNALRYFVSYDPAASASEADSTLGRLDRDVAELEGHAAEA
ncbi:MAG: hypothetical protein L7S64_05010 [Longimicrobiales bacterium]|jgi:hypothetical protein|nr:hypothetical protein [Longimicrobiales bacterium]